MLPRSRAVDGSWQGGREAGREGREGGREGRGRGRRKYIGEDEGVRLLTWTVCGDEVVCWSRLA